MSDNIYCVKNFIMQYRLACDTFHCGLKCEFDDVSDVLSKIKKNLFFPVEPVKSKNPYYYYGWSVPELGFNVFFDVKTGVLNCPVSVELDGKFFRLDEYSENFLDWFLLEFHELLLVQRCDCCIDVIYDLDELSKIQYDINSPYYVGFPVPCVKSDFKYNLAPFEGHFDIVDGKIKVDLLSCGRGEKKLRVYDKDLDLERKEHRSYSDVYGLKASRVFRIEYAIRGDSFKGLFEKYSANIQNSADLVYLILSGMFKRFSFENVSIEDVFNEDVSFYLRREKSSLENQITDCLNKMRKLSNHFECLNEKAYKEKCKGLKEPSLFNRSLWLKQIDFYNVAEKLGEIL